MILSPNIYLARDLGSENLIDSESDLRAEFFASRLRNSVLFVDSLDRSENEWFAHRRWISVAKSYRNRGSLLPSSLWSELGEKERDLSLFANEQPKAKAVESARISQLTATRVWHNTVESIDVRRSTQEFATLFRRLTHHTSMMQIVDPYFDLADDRSQYRWILDTLREHRQQLERTIVFHVDVNTKHLTDTAHYLEKWFEDQIDVVRDSILIVQWRDLHDRFLITERHVTTIGHGFGLAGSALPGKAHTTWAILNQKDAEVRRDQMDPRISRKEGWPIHVRNIEIT